MFKLSKIMNSSTLKLIYYAFFHSLINYGIIAWGGAYSNYLGLLQRLQNRLLKIINKNKFIVDNNPLNFNNCLLLTHYYIVMKLYNKNLLIQRV